MNLKPFTHVSVSQIETHELCRRKWWLTKIAGQPVPQHPSAALGSEVHASLEAYVKGESDTIHRLAGVHHVLLNDLHARSVDVEVSFTKPLPAPLNLNLVGKIDIVDWKSDPPMVLDWKTLSDQQYAKTEEELASNTQLLTYAKHIIDLSDAPVVRLAHATIPTRKGTGTFRYVDVAADVVQDYHTSTFLPAVAEMKATAQAEAPADVPPTLSACSAFGGCPFRGMCDALDIAHRSPYAAFDSQPTTPTTDENAMPYTILLALYRTPENIPLTEVARCMNPPYSLLLTAYKTPEAIPADVLSRCVDAPNGSATEPEPAPITPPEAVVTAPLTPAAIVDVVAPAPDSPEAMGAMFTLGWSEEEVNAMPDEVLTEVLNHAWNRKDVEFDTVPNAEAPNGYDILNVRVWKLTPVVVTEPIPPKRRGRPPGSKNKTTAAAPEVKPEPAPVVVDLVDRTQTTDPNPDVVVRSPFEEVAERVAENKRLAEAPVAEPSEEMRRVNNVLVRENYELKQENEKIQAEVVKLQAEVLRLSASPSEPSGPPPSNGFSLYLNCYPEVGMGDDILHLDSYLAPIGEMVAKNYVDEKTGRASPLPHWSVIPYGKGTAAIVAHVTGNLHLLAGKTVVVDMRSPAAPAVVEYLRPLANRVVVGRLS